MSEQICIHCYVSGRVQGVWFRANTKKEADTLGLTGFVRNLSDGRVEVMVCGKKEAVDQLRAWLQQGPPLAEVSKVDYEELTTWDKFDDFKTL